MDTMLPDRASGAGDQVRAGGGGGDVCVELRYRHR